jgi:hypothetical protein
MALLATTLAQLKQTMQSATDLGVPWDRFHDEFAMVPAFTSLGDVADNERIGAALTAVAEHVLGQRHPIDDAQFVRLAEHHFWHGHCQIGPRTVIFFYYDDIDVGVAGLFRDFADPRVELARMSVVALPGGGWKGRRPPRGTVQ